MVSHHPPGHQCHDVTSLPVIALRFACIETQIKQNSTNKGGRESHQCMKYIETHTHMQVHTYRFGWPTRLAGQVCAYARTCNTSLNVCVCVWALNQSAEITSASAFDCSITHIHQVSPLFMFIKIHKLFISNVAFWCWQIFDWSEVLQAWGDIFISVSYIYISISAGVICTVMCGAVKVFLPSYIVDLAFTLSLSRLLFRHVSSCSSSVDSWRSCCVTVVQEDCWALCTHWDIHLATKQTIMDTKGGWFFKSVLQKILLIIILLLMNCVIRLGELMFRI